MLQSTKRVKCFVSGGGYYSGEGETKARDKALKVICVEFRHKGCVWFVQDKVTKFRAWYK